MDKERLKEIFYMNNGSKPSKFTINAVTVSCFSAAIAKAGIPPISRVVLGSLSVPVCAEVEISIVGMAGETEFIQRVDFIRECFDSESYSLKKTDSCVFEFDNSCFTYDNAFLSSLEKETLGEIYVRVRVGETQCVAKTGVTLLPENVWTGLETEPSVVCTYVCPQDEAIEKICKKIPEAEPADYCVNSKKTHFEIITKLYKQIKECNIIYSRPSGYTASSRQRVRSFCELFGSGSILATPLEISLVFSSAAHRCGFDTSLLFVRTAEGEINVLCGVYLVNSPITIPVCENAEKIKVLVQSGDMLIVNPSVFAAAQNTSFAFACKTASEGFANNPASLVCMVDVKSSLKSMNLYERQEPFCNLPVRNGVAKLYSSLVTSPVMQYLSGKERCEQEEIPLLYPDFNEAFKDTSEKKLLPIEINVNLEDFAAIDKDFSSILTMFSTMAKQHFSTAEKQKMNERLNRFKKRISSPTAVMTSLRDEALYNTALQMTFGKNKRETYFAFGYVKITDKLTELVSFAPVCLVKAVLKYDNGSFYVRQSGKPIVNKVFIRNALKDSALGYDSFMKSLMPEDKGEIFDMFENIRKALAETDDRHVYEIIREAHLVNLEIDDYILWCNLALERNMLAMSSAARSVFGDAEKQSLRFNREYAPASVMHLNGTKAVCTDNDVVVKGSFTQEKEEVLYGICARSITEGKSLLIVTDDDEQSKYVEKVLSRKELSDCVLCTDSETSGKNVSERMEMCLEKYGFIDDKAAVGFMPKELSEADRVLKDYTARLEKMHPLGMTLRSAQGAYLYACKGLENVPEIPVSDALLEGAAQDKLEAIFEMSGEIIALARKLCERSGLKKYTPICRHPLYSSKPARVPTEAEMTLFDGEVQKLLGILSEYRDVFSDVNEILGFDDRDVDSIAKLDKLNELYKVVLSARELDIPERFIESDIEGFTKTKRFVSQSRKRMQEIESELGFFGKEIFEDVENLLRVNENGEEEKGFLKKFMLKKNDKDMLMQYVEPSGKTIFSQHKVSDIYKLLGEYKACKEYLENENSASYAGEGDICLAQTAEKSLSLIESICGSEAARKRLLSNVFRLICVIPVDSNLARKMTLVRANLEEAFYGEGSSLKVLSAIMGIDFVSLNFEDGILSFDGLAKHLKEMNEKLECTALWTKWLTKSENVASILPGFVEYLNEHGALENVERLFAKSLLFKVCERIKTDVCEGYHTENTGKAKDSYPELLEKAAAISKNNVFASYLNTVNHLKQVNTKANLESYAGLSLRTLLEKEFRNVTRILPVIIVTKNDLTSLLPLDCTFDNVVCLDNKDNGYSMLPALGYGKRASIINMSRSTVSPLAMAMSEKVPSFDVCSFTYGKDAFTFTWLNSSLFGEKCSITKPFVKSNSELVRMNGTFERTTGRVNKTEAEQSLIKSAELCADKTKSVAVTAFTKEQCTAIERMLVVVSCKNKILKEAVEEGRICVCTPDRLYMKNYNCLVVSACFGQDREGRIGWDFGYAGKSYNEEIPEAYISISDKAMEKMYFLTSLNVKDTRLIRRTGKNAEIFNSFCELLCDGRVPVCMRNSDGNENDSLIPGIMSYAVKTSPRVVPCKGKIPLTCAMSNNELFVLVDKDGGVSMHDELLVKKSIEKEGVLVTTLSPFTLAGSEMKETLDKFSKENSTERISG